MALQKCEDFGKVCIEFSIWCKVFLLYGKCSEIRENEILVIME